MITKSNIRTLLELLGFSQNGNVYIKKYEDKLPKEQRKLSHTKKGSNNWNKQRIKVAKVYQHITD